MKIQELKIECTKETEVHVWARCHSIEDIDAIIAWLQLAKGVMIKWKAINAKASRAPEAPTGQHEASEPRKIQGEPQVAKRANG